jgi:hypothetical protein
MPTDAAQRWARRRCNFPQVATLTLWGPQALPALGVAQPLETHDPAEILMTTIPCRVLAAALASAALSAGAAPSLADAATPAPAAKTALATAIAQMRPVIYERVNPLNAHNEIVLLQNVPRFRKFAAKMADIPADAAQRTARHEWVSGVLLEAIGNKRIAAGLQAKVKHEASLYRSEVLEGRATLGQANGLVRRAEASVGLCASSPAYFVHCARSTCPAG